MKEIEDNTGDSMEKAVQKRAVFEKEVTEGIRNGKNAMAMGAVD